MPSPTQQALLMAGSPGDPFWNNVVLLMGFEGTDGSSGAPGFNDESPAAHGTATVSGTSIPTISVSQFVFGASSLSYPVSSQGRVTFPDSANWDLGNGLFTIECRVRPATITGGSNRFMVAQWEIAPNLAWTLFHTNTTIGWNVSTTGSNSLADMAGGTLVLNTWSAVAVDYDGTKYRMYQDGVMVSSSLTARTIFNSTLVLSIGCSATATAAELFGFLDELRITKGIARYASDSGYTIATSPFPRHA